MAMTRPAAAQTYPQRPVKIIVPYAPGGGTDVFSRLLAAQIEREFGQPLVIDNRAGGASIVGTQAVATAQPDGYTIGMVDSAFVTNPGLYGASCPTTRAATSFRCRCCRAPSWCWWCIPPRPTRPRRT